MNNSNIKCTESTSGREEEEEEEEENNNMITKIKKIFDVRQDQGTHLRMWNSIFVISCAFAVSLDPLFFYVVNFKEDKKCLHTDEKLEIVALVLRSLTDVIFFVHLICEISALKMNISKNEQSEAVKQAGGNSGKKWEARGLIQYARELIQYAIARKIIQNMLSIIIDVLVLIPVPQLIILMFYPREGSRFVERKTFVNVFLLGQYVPRVLRIHLSAKAFKRMNGRWAKGIFNLFLYILAGHVLGAFWYFFSIQRAVSCWYEACEEFINTCKDTLYYKCEDALYCDSVQTTRLLSQTCLVPVNSTAINVTEYLKYSCPLDTPDGASPRFNFGIFLDSLKNENPNQEFGKQFVYSFWWGLRNLSNFGTNLVTSTYVLENLFAILISVTGLLLFIYLIGNVELQKDMIRQKIRMKKLDVCKWIHENNFPDDIQNEIMNSLVQALKKDKDDVHNPFLILPWHTRRSVKRHLLMDTLRTTDEKVLTFICDYLKPVIYSENNFVFDSHGGQRISSMAIKPLGKGHFYKEELVDWANCFTKFPVSSKHVKTDKSRSICAHVPGLGNCSLQMQNILRIAQCNSPEEVALATIRRVYTNALALSPARIADVNGESLPLTVGN
ncbi:cyclic nucleotide-gated ion channel 1-like [Pyrus ussuriensis x Pyrus communis]|uniref:Cyclic nucleotide-gated ion channel 1-like n=1 Tax=Pyrus ussuriensis x Pyrus communis TaxID=2448454 RepID=A0A5N5FMY3_9ROSA|nr:cyclic nucleotide-gated ion channel 1-like [Pyrus ussuriensis x Pyrus communis]